MKQELQTISPPRQLGNRSPREFDILFALAGPGPMSVESLAARIGFGTRECGRAVAELQRRYLVDLVSGLEGRAVKETLRLTEDGESSLMNSLEKMCELPELPSD